MESLTMWLWVHLALIFSGFASLLAATAAALLYLFQASQLKSKHFGHLFFQLPSLETLDKFHFKTLGAGVLLFSLGTLSGFFWAETTPGLKNIFKDPKVLTSLLACAMYLVVLSIRMSALKRGQKIAYSTVLIFSVFFLALLASYYCPVGFHKGF